MLLCIYILLNYHDKILGLYSAKQKRVNLDSEVCFFGNCVKANELGLLPILELFSKN